MRKLTRKEIMDISNTLSISFKKAASYVNKKYDAKLSFNYEFLFADDIIVLYYYPNILGYVRENGIEIIDCFREKADTNLPGHIDIGEDRYTLYIIPSIVASRNDVLFEIFSNSYSIIIPTSTKHGLNIVDENKKHPLYDITAFMRENMVWCWRLEDGPNNCDTPEDDCSLREYVISILEYI